MFGLQALTGMRIISFYTNRVPENCTGIVLATPSGATRYYVFSPTPIPTYGHQVVEDEARIRWMDGFRMMTEQEARANPGRGKQSHVNVVMCRLTMPLITQQISFCSKGSAITLADGTFVPNSKHVEVLERQVQIPQRESLATFLKSKKALIEEYNQFPNVNASMDDIVMKNIRLTLPKKAYSFPTSKEGDKDAAMAAIATTKYTRAVHKSGVPWGVDLTGGNEIHLYPKKIGFHQLDFTVVATCSSLNFAAMNTLMDALYVPHSSIRATATEAACLMGDFPVIRLSAYDSVTELNMHPFRGADRNAKYSTSNAWVSPKPVAKRFGIINSISRIHGVTTNGGMSVVCCHFRALVSLLESGHAVKIACHATSGHDVVCTAWKLTPAHGGGVSPFALDTFSTIPRAFGSTTQRASR